MTINNLTYRMTITIPELEQIVIALVAKDGNSGLARRCSKQLLKIKSGATKPVYVKQESVSSNPMDAVSAPCNVGLLELAGRTELGISTPSVSSPASIAKDRKACYDKYLLVGMAMPEDELFQALTHKDIGIEDGIIVGSMSDEEKEKLADLLDSQFN